MDEGLADMLRVRLAHALASPWASEAVTGTRAPHTPITHAADARIRASLISAHAPCLTAVHACPASVDWSALTLGNADTQHIQLPSVHPGGPMAGMPPPFPLGAGPPGAPSQSGVTDVSMGNTAEKPSVAGTAADFGQWTEEEVNTINGMQGQFSNLRVRKLIDEGASSQVWEGDWAGARVVIKVLREQEALRSFLSEVNIWRQLRHPCVCALLGVCMFDGRPSMVLEYMTGGSLHDLLHNSSEKGELDPMLISRMVSEVASGVAYLHSNGVMHRDVKTANVLLDDSRHAKVTDFGISTRFGRKDYTAETGTYRQMAPEVSL